jgi:hypothetical protein
MGLFKNTVRNPQAQITQQLLRNATEVTTEIDKVLSEFLTNQEQFEMLSEEMMTFSKRVGPLLSSTENTELRNLTENICDLHEEYLNAFRMIASISEKQYFRNDKSCKTLKKTSSISLKLFL